jgi:hypothetical protein
MQSIGLPKGNAICGDLGWHQTALGMESRDPTILMKKSCHIKHTKRQDVFERMNSLLP